MKRVFFLCVLGAFALLVATRSYSHEVVGEVGPLVRRMESILQLIESGKHSRCFVETEKAMNGFRYGEQNRREEGLRTLMRRVDGGFGTSLEGALDEAVGEKDHELLRKTLQAVGVLLMVEKFNLVEAGLANRGQGDHDREALFWQGRNYFSILLEPTLAKYAPSEELRMDRLLNRMLYGVEDGEPGKFRSARAKLLEEISSYFELPLPASVHKGGRGGSP